MDHTGQHICRVHFKDLCVDICIVFVEHALILSMHNYQQAIRFDTALSTLSLNIELKPHSSKILWTKSVHICSKYYSCTVLAYVCIIAKNYFLNCNHAPLIINCNWETTKFSLYHKLKYTVSYFENYFKTRPIYFVILFFPNDMEYYYYLPNDENHFGIFKA